MPYFLYFEGVCSEYAARRAGPALRCERGVPILRIKQRQPKVEVEGAIQKANGKWTNCKMFPGRDFDDLDAYRAAKKQRKERRAAHTGQVRAWRPGH